MIVTKTPYRISFFGGGTDYYAWYEEHGGEILSTSIDRYIYLTCRKIGPFHLDYRNRFVWKIMESTNSFNEIQNKAFKEALRLYDIPQGIEIHSQTDLPNCAGLGSSSSFCAGLIKALNEYKGKEISNYDLSRETIRFERETLGESGGIQDQIAVIHGGFNHIIINCDGSFTVTPVNFSDARKKELNSRLLLFFTGISRLSSDICKKQIENTKKKTEQLHQMQEMVGIAKNILTNDRADLNDFGKMLHETWQLKRSLTEAISNSEIDNIYETGIKNGAVGGKILGAGSGGFILFYAPSERHDAIKDALKGLMHVPFKFGQDGCRTILNEYK